MEMPASTNTLVPSLGPHPSLTNRVLVASSGMFLWMRIYCKLIQKRGPWWDDHTLIASWIALIVTASLSTASVAHGFGKHTTDLDPPSICITRLLNTASGTFSIAASAWIKTSFALTLLRIGHERRVRIFIWFAIVSINLTRLLAARSPGSAVPQEDL